MGAVRGENYMGSGQERVYQVGPGRASIGREGPHLWPVEEKGMH